MPEAHHERSPAHHQLVGDAQSDRRARRCGLAALLAGCGSATAPPEDIEACLRHEGLGVARDPGVSPPVQAKINFDVAAPRIPSAPAS
jgi:hypothetical protein